MSAIIKTQENIGAKRMGNHIHEVHISSPVGWLWRLGNVSAKILTIWYSSVD